MLCCCCCWPCCGCLTRFCCALRCTARLPALCQLYSTGSHVPVQFWCDMPQGVVSNGYGTVCCAWPVYKGWNLEGQPQAALRLWQSCRLTDVCWVHAAGCSFKLVYGRHVLPALCFGSFNCKHLLPATFIRCSAAVFLCSMDGGCIRCHMRQNVMQH